MSDLTVTLNRLHLQNPILVASGTFGYGPEIQRFFDPGRLGAIVGKSITLPEPCSMAQVSIQSGRGEGARFMKKNGAPAPPGYRFITIARSFR